MTTAPPYSHREVIRVIGGIALCILLSALDQTIVAPAIPAMSADLGGFGDFSWIISAYLLTSTAATPIIGKLSDSYGRRKLTLASIVVFTAASALCGLAQSLPQMIAFRALQGIGGAGLIAMAHAAIADVVTPRERGRYQVYMSGMWGLASIGGPVVGGLMTEHWSWRAIFWVNLPLSLVAYRLSSRALRLLPPRHVHGARIDVAGAALLTVAVVCCLVLIGRVGHAGGAAPLTAALIVAGVAALVALAWQERRATDPMLPLRLFGEPVVVRGFIMSFTNSLITFATTLLFTLHAQLVNGVGAGQSGLLLTPYLLTFVALSFGGGRLSRRLGRTRAIMSAAFACCAAGLLLLASVSAGTPLYIAVLYSLLIGAGIGLVQPNITVTIQNACERRDVGVATGCMLLLRSIGGAFGAAMAGAIVAQGMAAGDVAGLDASFLDASFHWAFLACAVVALLSLGVALTTRDLALRSA
jgi:EmrB/QacA subfamily drug resistance transporter